jgi:predicted lipoprotein with Yx(FWY)xxD motif
MAVATRRTSLRIGAVAAVAAAVAVSAAVWSGTGAASARHVTKAPTVMTRKVGKYGVILVNGKGLTLYMFVPDKQKKVTCKGACALI